MAIDIDIALAQAYDAAKAVKLELAAMIIEDIQGMAVYPVDHIANQFYWRIIPARSGADPYSLRVWLTPPKHFDAQGQPRVAESTVLHYFYRGDDDDALHDHPCEAHVTILSGGYTELTAPYDWVDLDDDPRVIDADGMHLANAVKDKRKAGATFGVYGHIPHMITDVQPNTFTIFTAGPIINNGDWHFYPHGIGKTHWREYLGREK